MTVYFQGAEKADFILSAWTGHFTYDTFSSAFTSANARGSMYGGPSLHNTEYLDTTPFSATEFWTHFKSYFAYGSGSSWHPYFAAWYGGATPWIALAQTSASVAQLRWWTGSAWASIGSFTCYDSTLNTFDVYIRLGNPGEVRVYLGGVPVMSTLVLDTTFGGAVTAYDRLRLQNVGNLTNTVIRYSEVIVADWNTIGSRLVTRIPNAAGTHNAWGGAGFGSVDDLTEDAVMMASGTVDQRFSVNVADFPALGAGESIEAVKVGAVAVKDATGPQALNFFTRVSSTDYDVGGDQPAPASIGGLRQVFEVNPATGLAWTVAELNAAEFGVRSRI